MKNPLRVLIPIFIVALLVTLSVGIAFAREINLAEKLGTKVGLISQNSVATNQHSSQKLADPVKPSSSEPPMTVVSTIRQTNTITDEMTITGTVEIIMTDTWTVSGQAFAVTPETEIGGNIVVGDKVKVELFMSPTNVLTASQIELLSENQDEVTQEFTGTVEALSPVSITVSGHVLAITPETEIGSNVVVGAKVKVEALVNPDGSLTAQQVELLENDDEQGENQQGNCDENECENHQAPVVNQPVQCEEDHCGGVTSGGHEGDHEGDQGGNQGSSPYNTHDGGGD